MQSSNDLKTVYGLACLDIGENEENTRAVKEAFEQILLYMRIHQGELHEIEHTFLYCETVRLHTLATLLNAIDLNNSDEMLDLSCASHIVNAQELSDYDRAIERIKISANKFNEYLCARIERWKNGLMLTQEMVDKKIKPRPNNLLLR